MCIITSCNNGTTTDTDKTDTATTSSAQGDNKVIVAYSTGIRDNESTTLPVIFALILLVIVSRASIEFFKNIL